MRVLSGTLETDQKKAGLLVLAKTVLTGDETYTYTTTRIKNIVHSEAPYNQRASVLLDNSDKTLTDLDLKGYKGVNSYGLTTSGGDVYSSCAPLWVVGQQFESSGDRLVCRLELIGIPNLMARDKANADYIPDATDTKTVKTLLRQICGDSGETILDCFDHCISYNMVFDSEDSLIDTFKPKDAFRISKNGSRLDAFKRLIKLVGCVARVEDDGKWHIFVPEDTDLDYEYKLLVAGEHTFFIKTYRRRVVFPAYVVVSSRATDEGTEFTGYAEDTDTPSALRHRAFYEYRVTSNDEAEDIATAILLHYQLDAERGAGFIPMNVGAECYDYVKITDSRENDNRIGNIGQLTRYYSPGQWSMGFHFGGVELGTGIIIPGFGAGGAGRIDYSSNIMDIYGYLNQIVDMLDYMTDGSWAPEFRILSVTNRLQIPSKTVGSDYL